MLYRNKPHFFSLFILFSLLLIFGAYTTLTQGFIPFDQVFEGLILRLLKKSMDWNPLLDERLPRLIVLISTGSSLAVSGAVLQSLFQNPLASPSILGISCGGSLAVTLAFAFGLQKLAPYAAPLFAVCGCLMTLLIVYGLSKKQGHSHMTLLILSGIAISTLLLAIKSAINYALRDNWQLIQLLTEWEAGSTTDRNWTHVHMQLPLTLIGLTGCCLYRNEMNILSLGEEEAKNLGVSVGKVRWRLFLCVALLTGGAIAACGIIAFFGLVLPHLVRRLTGPYALQVIPLNIIAGSATFILLDIFLRFFQIHALSIGNVSAILGAVFFVSILLKETKSVYC